MVEHAYRSLVLTNTYKKNFVAEHANDVQQKMFQSRDSAQKFEVSSSVEVTSRL